MIRMIFSTVRAPHDPALTVESFAISATGNIATEELVHMVEDMGVATGIDLDAMIAAAAEAEGIVGRELPSQVLRAGPRTRTIAP